MKKKPVQEPNFVAKHAHEFNKCVVFVDRKKAAKKGYSKHRHALGGRGSQGDSIAA